MGNVHICADTTLGDRLSTNPMLTDLVGILWESVVEPPDIWLLWIRSPLLPFGYNHFGQLVSDGSFVKV